MTSEVHNIDCLEYMRTLPDNYFQLAIADPPYGSDIADNESQQQIIHATGTRFKRYESTGVKCPDWDLAPKQEFFDELFRVAQIVIIWGGNYFPLPPSRCILCWDKKQPEGFSMAMAEYAWTNMNSNAKIFRMQPQGNPKDPRFHPTQKPVELYAWLLRNYATDGDRIFDPMMGSQSSRIAAYKLGFDYVGCELDKEYFDKGCERFNRECKGEIVTKEGNVIKQMSFFD